MVAAASSPSGSERGWRITLLRHGEATDDAPTDDERCLSERGRRTVRRVSQALGERDTHFDVIVSSPLVRAVQTAEILASAIGHDGPLQVDRALRPMASPADVSRMLAGLGARRVALVAHEPILSSVLADLTGQARVAPLRKAEAVRVRMANGAGALGTPGSLRWRIDPDDGKLHRDKARGDRPREDRPREDRPREDRPREDRPRQDRPRQERTR